MLVCQSFRCILFLYSMFTIQLKINSKMPFFLNFLDNFVDQLKRMDTMSIKDEDNYLTIVDDCSYNNTNGNNGGTQSPVSSRRK